MAEFDALLKSSIVAPALRLKDFAVEDKARSGGGREVVISVSGVVTSDNDANAATNMTAVVLAIKAASGSDFTIYGPGDVVLLQLFRSQCRDGGPHVAVSVGEMAEAGLLERPVKFTISSDLSAGASSSGGGATSGPGVQSLRVVKVAENQGSVTQSGTIAGSGLSDASLQARVFGPFAAAFPRPDYVISEKRYEFNADASEASYEVTATRLASPLPGHATVIGGDAGWSRERDASRLLTVRRDYNLLLSEGDPDAVLDVIRPADVTIQSESISFQTTPEFRLRATFVVLSGGDGTPVAEWKQQARIVGGQAVLEERRYPGIDPLLVESPKGTPLLYQSGSATTVGRAMLPPAAHVADRLASDPEVSLVETGNEVYQTSWSYVMFFDAPLGERLAALASLVKRPTTFEFVPGIGSQSGGEA